MNRKEYKHLWYLRNKKRLEIKLKKFYSEKPWAKPFHCLRSRCCNTTHWYYKKGIKNFLTEEDVKCLWFRDKAYLMTKPTVDRIDNFSNYTYSNCRFMEMRDNVKNSSRGKITNKWAKNYDKCIKCKSDRYEHHAKGYCNYCYNTLEEKAEALRLEIEAIKCEIGGLK